MSDIEAHHQHEGQHGKAEHVDLMDALATQFCKVELQFLSVPSHSTRQRRASAAQASTTTGTITTTPVFVRDVANLLLWTVPAPIPLIDSPRAFFVKNRSRVRNVVVIYVNRWSYDKMMCTGVRLSSSSSARARNEDDDDDDEKDNDNLERPWNARICQAMLAPVRTNRCWARVASVSSSSTASPAAVTPDAVRFDSASELGTGGVQYCPLLCRNPGNQAGHHERSTHEAGKSSIESRAVTHDRDGDALLRELFWRNERPRTPGAHRVHARPGSDASRTAKGDSVDVHTSRAFVEGGGVSSELCASYASSSYISRGVGHRFRQAQVLHSGGVGSPTSSEPACTLVTHDNCTELVHANNINNAVDTNSAKNGDTNNNNTNYNNNNNNNNNKVSHTNEDAETVEGVCSDETRVASDCVRTTTATASSSTSWASMHRREDWQRVWGDAALLRRYALHYPEHADVLQMLGFTLPPRTGPNAAVSALADRNSNDVAELGTCHVCAAGWREVGQARSDEPLSRSGAQHRRSRAEACVDLGDGVCDSVSASHKHFRRERDAPRSSTQVDDTDESNVCRHSDENSDSRANGHSSISHEPRGVCSDMCKDSPKSSKHEANESQSQQQQPQKEKQEQCVLGSSHHSVANRPDQAPRVYAFDCEMVQVQSQRSALARGTLVNLITGEVVLDVLVQPDEDIVDYRTRYSGIDADMLCGVTCRLADFQEAFLRHVDEESFLVGHSLENDLLACQLYPTCFLLDTTWLFPHPAGLPCKNALRYLATRYLRQTIQCGSHDSVEDAWASAALAHLKMIRGPAFAAHVASVSLIELMTSTTGSAAQASLKVDVRLFDEAASLQYMLPRANRNYSANTNTAHTICSSSSNNDNSNESECMGVDKCAAGGNNNNSSSSSHSPLGGGSLSRVDPVPVRHDEDAVRKVVRALRRDATTPSVADANEVVHYRFTWLQLHETAIDVEHRYADGHGVPLAANRPAHTSTAPVIHTSTTQSLHSACSAITTTKNTNSNTSDAVQAEKESDARLAEKERAHEAVQLERVAAVNNRVMRVVEACADDTIVLVLAADCRDDARTRWSNFYSHAQGVCFGFVKDSQARGPAMGRKEAGPNADEQAVSVPSVKADALGDDTPPACRHQ